MQYIIEKKGRIGIINPVPIGSLALTLEKNMMYTRQNAHWFPNPLWAIVRMYKIKTGKFPWGLIDKVKEVFEAWVKVNNTDNYNIIGIENIKLDDSKYSLLSSRLRDYQKDAILGLIINNGGLIVMPTGSGKTFTVIEYLKYMNMKTLVLVPTLNLVKQWKKQVPDFVDISTYQSAKKYDPKNYKILVADEVHRIGGKTYYNAVMQFHYSIIVSCTATNYREDGENMKITAGGGKVVYEIGKKELIDKGYLSNAKVYYITLNDDNKDRFIDYPTMYNLMIVNNDERNDRILEICKKYPDKKKLILINQIEHGTILTGLLKEYNPLFIHGKIKERDVPDNCNLLIGSNVFSEGVDLPAFEILILAAGGKSSVQLVQRVGRVLRKFEGKEHAIIYDFKDESRYLSRHYKRRRQILEEDFPVIDI